MEKYKLFSFDIDGTLLPYTNKDFYPEIKEMFVKLKEKNKVVVFCTGREMITIGSLLDDVSVDYFLGANGSFIYDCKSKKIIYEDKISHKEFKMLSNFLENEKCDHSVMTENYGYFSEGHSFDNWFLRDHVEKFKNLNELEFEKENLHIITVKTSDPNMIEKTKKFLKENNLDLEINSTWSKGFFINKINSNKASGLKKLGKILNIDLSEMMAFGDGSNDYEMIKEVGYGVAMEGAPDYVVEVANDKTSSATEMGTYLKLKELGIIS
ncbi:YcsE-related riboflavin metabolism phosphatase [Mesomycoplasma molare]|uniref:Cof-type HAD-IIB family hydrolase n=1 Tax=Mesomycoplasma molare TaxID=171288 RepID=A0ABY5TX31_9BACT|nr:HAD family hydrolase [Mesomycoplasma molare]UWD34086.1 Cof-type HAD-IIB family hydrolase [Mesomycoplasma molare]